MLTRSLLPEAGLADPDARIARPVDAAGRSTPPLAASAQIALDARLAYDAFTAPPTNPDPGLSAACTRARSAAPMRPASLPSAAATIWASGR